LKKLLVIAITLLFLGCATPREAARVYHLHIIAVGDNISQKVTIKVDAIVDKTQKADAKTDVSPPIDITGIP